MFKAFSFAALAAASLALAPVAVAAPATSADKPMQGRQMTYHGASVPFLIGHSYKEALHATESLAMGMDDMARNHLDNVSLVLGRIDLNRDVTDKQLRDRIASLRDRAKAVENSPSLDGAKDLVSRFTTLVAAMPMPKGGGGGGGNQTAMLMLPAELVAEASGSAAELQIALSQGDSAAARLASQQTLGKLDQAIRSAKLHRMSDATIRNLQTLRTRAQSATGSAAAAGKLVQQIAAAVPTLTASAGGGAGTTPNKR